MKIKKISFYFYNKSLSFRKKCYKYIFGIIIICVVLITILSYFWIFFLWGVFIIISIILIIVIIYNMICNKKKKKYICFCIIFTYNIIYIIIVIIFWSVNHCSLEFLKKYWYFSVIFFIIELFFIIFNLRYYYKKYKNEGTKSENKKENKIFPFAICEYINSNLNLDNLIENEIIKQGEEQAYKGKIIQENELMIKINGNEGKKEIGIQGDNILKEKEEP